ncbi:hypothetical protein ACEQMU_004777 [Salmonella enterica]|uniref:hypothetical protein n=1 Tax=Serratia marcescens TaxID=615 RepID=UPI00355EF548
MKVAKVWIDKRTIDAMVDKILTRLESLDSKASSPCAGITRENCPDYIFARVKEEIEAYGRRPDADLNDYDRAFVFGLPLNDTVFMLTGCAYPDKVAPQAVECIMQQNAGTAESYTVDFYHSVAA